MLPYQPNPFMPSQLPRSLPTQKLEILAKREARLQKLLGTHQEEQLSAQITKGCEAVRISKIGVLKTALSARDDKVGLDKLLGNQAELNNKLTFWQIISASDIAALYKAKK